MTTVDGEPIPRWLFDSLVLCRLDLATFSWDRETLEEDLNRSVDPFHVGQLASLIHRAVGKDLLEIHAEGSDIALAPGTLDRVEHVMRGPLQRHFLGLTAQGGASWEAVTRPDWSRFVECSTIVDFETWERAGTWSMFIEASSQEKVDEVFGRIDCMGYRCVDDLITRSLLAPWEATYWKTLAEGHRLEFLVREVEPTGSISHPDWHSRYDYWYG